MPKFTYVVKDRSGKSYQNVVEANNQSALITELQKRDYFIVSITEIKTASPAKKSVSFQKKHQFSHKKIKLIDMLIFGRQLATMLEAGVTLIRGLGIILQQVQSKELHKTLAAIKADVEQGTSLSQSMTKHPKVFNQFWISLIEVGEASGTIPMVLGKLAFYLEQQAAFRSKIISGIIYPAILFCVSMGAVAFFALFVGPKFESIFKQMNADLPTITVVLLTVFKFIKAYFFLLTGAAVGCFFLFKQYIKTYTGKLRFEKFLFGLPTFGPIFNLIIVERFTAQMAILIDSGVPILYALDICERLVDNNTCSLIVHDVKESVKQGELLVQPMERSGFFPPMCTQMISVGEETGEMSKMLKQVAKFYQSEVETFMDRFATIVEPFMLVGMGGVIGTIVLAMFMPMFNLSQLSGGGG